MRRRQPLHHPPIPRCWLMTDLRQGDALWTALEALPKGAGVVFRHYELAPGARRTLLRKVARVARRRRLLLIVAGREQTDRTAAGSHGRHVGALTAPVHSRREAVAAARQGVQLAFVSPVYPTRSHPDTRTLGRVRLGLLLRALRMPAIALGGMDTRRWRSLRALDIYGWAGIDAWKTEVD